MKKVLVGALSGFVLAIVGIIAFMGIISKNNVHYYEPYDERWYR